MEAIDDHALPDAEEEGSSEDASEYEEESEYESGETDDEDGDDEDYSYDESDDDEEEEEPKLKYQRLGSNVIEILKRDAASCMCVHDKFLALGTHWGVVYVLDFNGNEIKRFTGHSATVNELSLDMAGEFIASCSDDGKVIVSGLYSSEQVVHSYKRPVISVALDPLYSKGDTRQVACGGRAGQLVLVSKGFMGFGSKNNVLHSGEGPIYAIKWCNSLIAWANDKGVKIYDCHTNQRITYIDRPRGSPRPDLYRCNLCWEDENTLLIGWADSIKVGQVKERRNTSGGLPTRYVEIVALFQTDYWICGIAPFGEYLVTLAYVDGEEDSDGEMAEEDKSARPELRLITRKNVEISSDALTIHGFEHYKATDYRLDHMAAESLFYVVSPKDIVVAKPRDLDDHITWLLANEKYETALSEATSNEDQIRTHKLTDIGERYLAHLMDSSDYNKAAALCPKILKHDAKLWEKWIFRFAKKRQLKAISPYIPIGNPRLSQTVYEMVLNYFLKYNHEGFLRTIQEWSASLYNIHNIITAVIEQLRHQPEATILMDSLAHLYTYDEQFDKTLHIYLRLKRGNVFGLIEKYYLFDAIQDKVSLLMHFDEEKAVELLIENRERMPIARVVSQLEKEPYLQHIYLHTLFERDPYAGKDFHELQVTLYADYDYSNLMPFLKQSNYYPLEKALQICEERKLYPEMVFILGRMGNNSQALELIMEKQGDVKQAIDFVSSQNDEELWDDLIEYSMKNPRYVSGLLEHIGGAQIDPKRLINRIPMGMHIEGLRDRLVKIISDYNLQMSLRDGCNVILKADCVDLFDRLYRGQRSAVRVSLTSKCTVCQGTIVPGKDTSGCVVFFCSHVYHQRCLRKMAKETEAAKKEGDEKPRGRLYCMICQGVNEGKKVTKQAAVQRMGPR